MNARASVGALLGVMIALPASGQLAPPPPPPVEKAPVQYPPPPPPPRPPAEPARPRGMPAKPDFPFEPLAKVNDAGELEPLRQSPEYLALTRNPKIRAEQLPKIKTAMDEHFKRVDDLVIENIDLVMDAAGGVFDDADLNQPAEFNEIQGIMGVLMTARGLPEHLEQQDAIDKAQMDATKAIYADWVQTFNKVALDKAIAEHGQQNRGAIGIDMGRAMFHLLSMEAMLAFRRMALQVADDFDDVVVAADDVAEEAPEAVQQARKALAEAGDDDARYDAIVAFLQELKFSQQRAVLEANRKMAPPRDYAELKPQAKAEKQ